VGASTDPTVGVQTALRHAAAMTLCDAIARPIELWSGGKRSGCYRTDGRRDAAVDETVMLR
jgi:hypothetical protein